MWDQTSVEPEDEKVNIKETCKKCGRVKEHLGDYKEYEETARIAAKGCPRYIGNFEGVCCGEVIVERCETAEAVEPAEPEKCCGTCEHYGKDDENDDWLCNNLDTPYIEGCDLKYKFYCNHHTAKEVRDEH